jgi:hypothetical protein
VQSVSDQAVGVGVVKGVKPDQQLVKVESVISISFIHSLLLHHVLAFLLCLNQHWYINCVNWFVQLHFS